MQINQLPFHETGFFSTLICDYLNEKPELKPLYNRFPSLENFKSQIAEKTKSFNKESRDVLVSSVLAQYENVKASGITIQNIESLKDKKTFTITTGHQLNLFTGPLYFIYKIVSTINLSEQLKVRYPDYNFVPVYWMATEDHDFEEINYFNFKGKKVQWNRFASGAVGELSNEGLEAVFEVFSEELGHSKNAQHIRLLFQEAYLNHSNLAQATRYIANELFKAFGLVIIDANNSELKRLFVPFMKDELTEHISYRAVTDTNKVIEKLSSDYKVQVNPRYINLFYLSEGLRERIVYEDGIYKVLNSDIQWNEEVLLEHLELKPECFSPNVVMRPLYQEVILPNLCYIGGGGELSYWLQLKSTFNAVHVPFPILLLRNSVLLESGGQKKKRENLAISYSDLFLNRHALINKKVREISNINIDFSSQKEHLKQQFTELFKIAEVTDASFVGAVKAQEVKQLKGLEKLEKRLLQAQKKTLSDKVYRMTELQNQLFPNQSLQERSVNFSEFYLEYGDALIDSLIKNLDPLSGNFTILTMDGL
ncbi:bacillithiol biosynthesis cysteine-adding enzyme BshC [Cognatitamlana onchidii]|uniref:bacillithiol biosynthesis cysteine-adding enzyme BshC n=1 Tax=Cognatitamlana onchidii TaxID=2562860 RepID=UPI0010A619F1|nr:bacillithiol biosynthesis cysteine-adding enzyme BshC [Algibacter onchidii]